MDKKINEFERDVRRKVMTHLAVGGKEDIGSGLVLVSVVIDIERIGDYTKNIYDLALNHPKKLTSGSLESTLNDMENSTKDPLLKTDYEITCTKLAFRFWRFSVNWQMFLYIEHWIVRMLTARKTMHVKIICLYFFFSFLDIGFIEYVKAKFCEQALLCMEHLPLILILFA